MSDLVTRLSVLAEDDGDRYPAHVKKLAEAAASRIAALEAQLAEKEAENEQLRKALEDGRADEMRAYGPIPVSSATAALIEAVQTWVNQRGGEESLEQIVAMTAEAMRRAARRALTGGKDG